MFCDKLSYEGWDKIFKELLNLSSQLKFSSLIENLFMYITLRIGILKSM